MYVQINQLQLHSTTSACWNNLDIIEFDYTDNGNDGDDHHRSTIITCHDNRYKISIIVIDNNNNDDNDQTLSSATSYAIDLCNDNVATVDGEKFNTIQATKLMRMAAAAAKSIYLICLTRKCLKIYSLDHHHHGDHRPYQLIFNQNLLTSMDSNVEMIVNSIVRVNSNHFCFATANQLRFYGLNQNAEFGERQPAQDLRSSVTGRIDKFVAFADDQDQDQGQDPSQNNRFVLIENNSTRMTIWKLTNDKPLSFIRGDSAELQTNTKLTCVQIYRNLMIIGTITGQIQIFDIASGFKLLCEIQAHVKCVTSMDLEPQRGYLISGSEDSYARLFSIEQSKDDELHIEFLQQFIAPNEMIFGTRFFRRYHHEDHQITCSYLAISTFESNQLKIFKMN